MAGCCELSGASRQPSQIRVAGVVVTRRGGVTRGDQTVDKRLILGGKAIVQGRHIVFPLRQGARPTMADVTSRLCKTQASANCPAVMSRCLACRSISPRQAERFGAPLRLMDARIVPAGARIGGRRLVRIIFGREHAARQRTVGYDTGTVMRTKPSGVQSQAGDWPGCNKAGSRPGAGRQAYPPRD